MDTLLWLGLYPSIPSLSKNKVLDLFQHYFDLMKLFQVQSFRIHLNNFYIFFRGKLFWMSELGDLALAKTLTLRLTRSPRRDLPLT